MIFLVFQIGAEKTWSFSMPQKLHSSIFLLDTIFHTTLIASSETFNSNLHLSSIFSVLIFLMISLGKITFFLTSKRLGDLRRLRYFFTPPQLLALYRGVIRPFMGYASHMWGGSTHTTLLGKVESRVFCLINFFALTNSLQSLSSRRIVASLSLYHRFFKGHCSYELLRCIPSLLRRARIRLSTESHPFSVQLSASRISHYAQSYIYYW